MTDTLEEASRRQRLFTVDEYERMSSAGILRDEERLELLRGVIYQMSPIHPPHAWSVNVANRKLVLALGDRAFVAIQNPVRLSDSMPQPDLVILPADMEHTRHGGQDDTLLAIEVADTSLRFDLNVKVPIYADNGVAEMWVLDVRAARLHVFRDLRDGVYADQRVIERGEEIAPLAFPKLSLRPEDLLG